METAAQHACIAALCSQLLYTVKTGHCKPHVCWLLSCIEQNRPPGHERLLHSMHALLHSAHNYCTPASQNTASHMCVGCCHALNRIDLQAMETAAQHACIAALCSQLLYTVKTGRCKPHVCWLLSCIEQNRPPGHERLLHSMHALLHSAHNYCTLSKQVTASHMCVGCCHVLNRIYLQAMKDCCTACMHCCILLTTTVPRQVKTLQATCVLAVVMH